MVRPRAAGVFWEILLGLASGTIGVYLMAHALAGSASLTLAVAIYLSVEAMLEFGAVVPAPWVT